MGRCWQRWIVFASTRHRISRDVSLIQPKFQGQLDAIELIPSFVEASKSNFFFQRPSRSKGPTISTPSITAASVCFFFFFDDDVDDVDDVVDGGCRWNIHRST